MVIIQQRLNETKEKKKANRFQIIDEIQENMIGQLMEIGRTV